MVSRIKEDFPQLLIEINGEVKTIEDMRRHLKRGMDGVMVGRAASDNPFLLALVDKEIYGDANEVTREQVITGMFEYVASAEANGEKAYRVFRHMLNLYAGVPGRSKEWKKLIAEHVPRSTSQDLLSALARFQRETLDPGRPTPCG